MKLSDWRSKMDEVRKEAVLLAREGTIDILQKKQAIPYPYNFKGIVRLRLCITADDKQTVKSEE
jgi:hypothetical protein